MDGLSFTYHLRNEVSPLFFSIINDFDALSNQIYVFHICFLIFQAIPWAIDRPCNRPCLLESKLILIVMQISIINNPSFLFLGFPILFKLNPVVLLSIILNKVFLGQLLTPNNWSFLQIVVSFNVSPVQPPHLMPIQALMELVFVFNATYPATARAFFNADHSFDHVCVVQLVLTC